MDVIDTGTIARIDGCWLGVLEISALFYSHSFVCDWRAIFDRSFFSPTSKLHQASKLQLARRTFNSTH